MRNFESSGKGWGEVIVVVDFVALLMPLSAIEEETREQPSLA